MGQLLFLVIILGGAIGVTVLKLLTKPKPPKHRLPNLTPPEDGISAGELARRLGISLDELKAAPVQYQKFAIPKRSGGHRYIQAPADSLKRIQRSILNRLLHKLKSHPAATGFEKGFSVVSNAFVHVDADVVLRMDIQNFFTATGNDRIRGYFYGLGWDQESTDILIRLCTHEGSLPQGAPTSPRLSNLVNYELDSRLQGWAKTVDAVYTRYADDITFSFRHLDRSASIKAATQNPKTLEGLLHPLEGKMKVFSTIGITKKVLAEYGYQIHTKRKLNIRYRHQQQLVTGLVVNAHPALPRKTRRWLRAVRHHLENGKPASLNAQQLEGWRVFEEMIEKQCDFLSNK